MAYAIYVDEVYAIAAECSSSKNILRIFLTRLAPGDMIIAILAHPQADPAGYFPGVRNPGYASR